MTYRSKLRTVEKFHVFPRVRRNEFAFGIVDMKGREVDNVSDENAALRIVAVMNANLMDPEAVAEVETKSRGGLRAHWLTVRRAIRNQDAA